MNKTLTFITLSTVCVFLISSCTKEKEGVLDPSSRPPMLLTAIIEFATLNLDSDTIRVAQLPDGRYRISMGATSLAFDVDGKNDLRAVSYTVFGPSATNALESGTLSSISVQNDTVQFAGTIVFTIQRSEAGQYTFEFQAQDRSNLRSIALRKSLRITRTNSIPRLSNLVAPDTIQRPTNGLRVLFFSVAVADSDGYGDIQEVFFKRIAPTSGGSITMFDTGDRLNFGDEFPGDGIFSRLVVIDSTALLGTQEFLFQAKDRFGTFSDSLIHSITITQ